MHSKRVFLRVALFYILAVLVVGMLVASDDPRLADESGTAAQSPFVIAAGEAGIAAIPHVVNAVVVTSAWSSANQALLAGTRVLYALALKRQAPAVFLRTTAWGVPWVCVAVQSAFMLLAFLSLSAGALAVFFWFVSLTAAGVLVSWSAILLNHLRLLRALRAQGLDPAVALPWHNRWTRYSTPAALAACLLILLTAGFDVFTAGGWDAGSFVSHYLDIPLVLAAFGLWKAIKKTSFVRLSEIPLREALEEIERNPEPIEKEPKGWLKAVGFLWD